MRLGLRMYNSMNIETGKIFYRFSHMVGFGGINIIIMVGSVK